MMLLATVFVACSDDDDEKDDDKPTDKVKLVSKIVTSSSEGIKELEETFEYDSQGRITKHKYYNIDEAYSYTLEYVHGDKTITMKDYEDDELYNTIVYTLENDMIVASSDDYNGKPVKFSYSDKYLVKTEKEGDSEILTWSNENLLRIGNDMSFTYTEYENKSNIDITSINFTEDAEFNDILFRSGYFGNRSKKLISTAKSEWHDLLYQYEYTFDNEGYVTTIKDIENGYTKTITYKE